MFPIDYGRNKYCKCGYRIIYYIVIFIFYEYKNGEISNHYIDYGETKFDENNRALDYSWGNISRVLLGEGYYMDIETIIENLSNTNFFDDIILNATNKSGKKLVKSKK